MAYEATDVVGQGQMAADSTEPEAVADSAVPEAEGVMAKSARERKAVAPHPSLTSCLKRSVVVTSSTV